MRYLLFFIALNMMFNALSAEHPVIRHITHSTEDDFRDGYYAALLDLSLRLTQQEYGGYSLQPVPAGVFQGRIIELLKAGSELDVIWTMTSLEREQQLIPIRVPLAKGIMGYRLLMIVKGAQSRFSGLTDKQLQRLWAGQAYDWPDSQILKANNYIVVTAPPSRLLAMLKMGRFDYFPRGLQEIWDEVDVYDGVEVEQSLLFYYPAPMFFFVNKKDVLLAKRIEKGLLTAIANGEHEKLLAEYDFIQSAVKRAKIDQRRVITLDNPTLSLDSRLALLGLSTQLHAKNDKH